MVGSQVGVEGQVTVGGQVGQVGGDGEGGQVTVGGQIGQVGGGVGGQVIVGGQIGQVEGEGVGGQIGQVTAVKIRFYFLLKKSCKRFTSNLTNLFSTNNDCTISSITLTLRSCTRPVTTRGTADTQTRTGSVSIVSTLCSDSH